jgi:histidinol phosphatase-like PHP family hydrolase
MDAVYKLDLHVHASERSACATSKEEDQIRAASAAGMHGMAFTDHHAQMSEQHLVELNHKYHPFVIYTGVEVTAEREDWLIWGVRDPQLQRMDWRYADLAAFVRSRNGFIALAHPFRYAITIQADVQACPPDGIELQSFNTSAQREAEIRAIAERLGLRMMKNSDAHSSTRVGKYWNELPALPANDQELVKLLLKHNTSS